MRMNNFGKAVCVLDTCSIINLDEIILGREDILRYVRCDFDVHVSEVVPIEFVRHRSKMHSREASYWERFLNTRIQRNEILCSDEDALSHFHCSPPVFGGTDNAGEYANARLAMELLMTRKAGQVIFVTDDEKACNAFLRRLCESFPGIILWTSLDVVFYVSGVLMMRGKIGVGEVEDALRDVVASAREWLDLSAQEKSNLVKRREEARRRLQALNAVAKVWRNSNV